MSTQNFDPMTGKPLNQEQNTNNTGYNFDPVTGKPIQHTNTTNQNGYNFDPMTGNPVNQYQTNGNLAYKFDPMTGQPLNQEQPHAPVEFKYDPVESQKVQQQEKFDNDKFRKNLAIRLGGAALAVVVLISAAVRNNKNNNDVPETKDIPAPTVDVTEPEKPAATTNTAPATTTTTTVAPKGTIDTDSMFAYSVGDYNYALPEKLTDYISDGWIYNDDNDATILLGSGETEYVYLHPYGNTDIKLEFDVTNFSLNAQEVQNCYVTQVTLYSSVSNRSDVKFTYHNGDIVVGESTTEDVKKIMGDPNYSSTSSSPFYTYYKDGDDRNYDSRVMFGFSDDNKLDYLVINNNVAPADFEQAEVSTEAPEYLSNYTAPTELGNDLFSGNFQIDNVVYTLPVPMQVLLDNGFTINGGSQTAVGAGEGYSIVLQKGNDNLYATAYNMSKNATTIENTIVTSVSVYPSSYNRLVITFPGRLSSTSTDADVQKVLSDNGIKNYEYKKDYKRYKIYFDQSGKNGNTRNRYEISFNDDGSLDMIDLTNYGWLLNN